MCPGLPGFAAHKVMPEGFLQAILEVDQQSQLEKPSAPRVPEHLLQDELQQQQDPAVQQPTGNGSARHCL